MQEQMKESEQTATMMKSHSHAVEGPEADSCKKTNHHVRVEAVL